MKPELIILQYIGYVLLIGTVIFCLIYKMLYLDFLIDATLLFGFGSIASFGLYYILDQVKNYENE